MLFFYFLQNALESVFPSIPFPFLIVTVIYFALTKGPVFGFGIGFFSGLLLEAFATGRFGTQLGLWAAAGFFSGLLSSRVFPDSLPVRLLLPPIIQAAMSFLEFLLRASDVPWTENSFPRSSFWFPTLMTLVTAPLVFQLLHPPPRRRS